jgi:hypothetical protein
MECPTCRGKFITEGPNAGETDHRRDCPHWYDLND